MATVTLISATGRLKNKIQISYTMAAPVGEILTSAGLAYGSTNVSGSATLVTAPADTPNYGYGPVQNNTFAGIAGGRYYVWAWALTSAGSFFSAPKEVSVPSSGYELSEEGAAIASPLLINDGTEGKDKALFSDSSGVATWKPVGEMFAYGHYIGELYGGGIVVNVWKEGDDEKVLIASLENLKGTAGRYDPAGSEFMEWILPYTLAVRQIGTQASSMYNGQQNTNAIIAFSLTGSAAQICSDYRGGGYDDWYLPSAYELNNIYSQAGVIAKVLGYDSFPIGDGYWSSTELGATTVVSLAEPGSTARMLPFRKLNSLRVRAVRRESVYTGDGLMLSLDATNSKSFSDASYYAQGTASRWSCLVNRGMSSSYSFLPRTAGSSSGGTLTQILTPFTTTGLITEIFNGTSGNWTLSFISSTVPTVPKLYNRTGESSFVSSYFTVAYRDAALRFESGDFSYTQGSGVSLDIYVSVNSPGYTSPYTLLRQISITTAIGVISTYTVPLYQYLGKSISIKISSPGSYWNSTSSFAGPSIDTIYLQGTSGGFQLTGPVYFPDQGGYLSFASSLGTNGSFFDFNAPIGTTNTVTVEVWARLASNYSGTMLFGWSRYDVYMPGGNLGYNTGAGDLYGISSARVTSLGLVGKWAHYVFEMRSDASYTNNKIYINGQQQTLSQILAGTGEVVANRNFNGGLGRIGGWRHSDSYLFSGDISVFRVYNRALTKDEIVKNFDSGRKRYEIRPSILRDGLYSYIDFNVPASYSGSGSTTEAVNDLGDLGNPATIVRTTTTTIPSVARTSDRLVLGVRRIIFFGTTTTNPYITWPTAGTALQSATDISVSFWIYFDESRTAEIIVKWSSASNGVGPWEVFQSSTVGGSNITFRLISGSTIYQRTGTKVIPNAKWTHVCATYNNASKKIKTYINSEIDIDHTWPSQMSMDTASAGDVFVGQYPPTAATNRYPLKGSISSIQIYTRTLGKEEVKNNYNADKFEFDSTEDANLFFSHELSGNPTFSINQNLQLEIPGKLNDRILSSDSSGNSVWTDKSYLFDRPINYRYIGELYGGGVIVAMWKYPSNIYNYLIMSTEDINPVGGQAWSNVSAGPAAFAFSEQAGASNSAAIMAQSGHLSSAAKLCDDYAGGGFTDWYLPSVQEMLQAYNAGAPVGYVTGQDTFGDYRGAFQAYLQNGTYWTSTECDMTLDGFTPDGDIGHFDAYVLNASTMEHGEFTSNGNPFATAPKTATYSVRAFRLAKVNERRVRWEPEWEPEYFPAWQNGWNIWDDSNWFLTSVTIGTNPIQTIVPPTSNATNVISPGSMTFTFSNSFASSEPVSSAGVCWSTSSTAPTISNNFVVASSISGNSFTAKVTVNTPPIGWATSQNTPIAFYRAYITTYSGYTYYSSNFGINEAGYTTYTLNGSQASIPGGVYVGINVGWINLA